RPAGLDGARVVSIYLMMACFCSGVIVRSLNTGMFWGPVSIASYMCLAETPVSAGAYFPCVRAPPLPAKLWHCAQFVRNSSPPSARLAPEVLSWSFVGIDGPGPSEAM